MDYVIRDRSVITGENNLEPLHTFPNFPVFFGCVDTPADQDVRADMSWAIDPETGVIQLDKLIPLDILYQEQHVDGTGPTWKQYYQDLAAYVASQHPTHVLEIGGGQGELGEIFLENTASTTWTIVEPNPLHEETDRMKIIPAFFDEHFQFNGTADAIVFSQLMEHVYDPHAFVKALAQHLQHGERLIFAYPNLKLWLERKYTNALNFEHTMLLTDYFVDYLLVQHGFRITDKRAYKDHSHFYTAERLTTPDQLPTLENKYTEYKRIFTNFIDYHRELVANLNKSINEFDGEVYLFGAHIFAQFLLEFGLQKDRLAGLLDNSSLKQGKRLYGSPLMVNAPESLRDKGRVGIVLKVGIYRDEILEQLRAINPDIVIFE